MPCAVSGRVRVRVIACLDIERALAAGQVGGAGSVGGVGRGEECGRDGGGGGGGGAGRGRAERAGQGQRARVVPCRPSTEVGGPSLEFMV